MGTPAPLKSAIHARCKAVLAERIHEAEAAIADTRASARSDTKSSAGDKHETGRAMAQLELEKQLSVLAHLHQMTAALDRLDPQAVHAQAGPGALLHTDSGLFYIAIALGRIEVDGQDVWAISAEAPVFTALKGVPPGGVGFFNGKAYRVLGIG